MSLPKFTEKSFSLVSTFTTASRCTSRIESLSVNGWALMHKAKDALARWHGRAIRVKGRPSKITPSSAGFDRKRTMVERSVKKPIYRVWGGGGCYAWARWCTVIDETCACRRYLIMETARCFDSINLYTNVRHWLMLRDVTNPNGLCSLSLSPSPSRGWRVRAGEPRESADISNERRVPQRRRSSPVSPHPAAIHNAMVLI